MNTIHRHAGADHIRAVVREELTAFENETLPAMRREIERRAREIAAEVMNTKPVTLMERAKRLFLRR